MKAPLRVPAVAALTAEAVEALVAEAKGFVVDLDVDAEEARQTRKAVGRKKAVSLAAVAAEAGIAVEALV